MVSSFRLVLKLFQIFSLLNSVATSAEDDEKTLFEKEMEIISKLMGYCPYCDPNFIDIPNLQSAMKGYDLPMGDPNRKCMQGFEKKMLFFCTFFPIFFPHFLTLFLIFHNFFDILEISKIFVILDIFKIFNISDIFY